MLKPKDNNELKDLINKQIIEDDEYGSEST